MLPKYRPPTHPGEMLLEEFLKPLGISQTALARHLGWLYAQLNEIINGKRGLTAASALDLGDALQTGPKFWLNVQRDGDLWHSKQKHQSVQPLQAVTA